MARAVCPIRERALLITNDAEMEGAGRLGCRTERPLWTWRSGRAPAGGIRSSSRSQQRPLRLAHTRPGSAPRVRSELLTAFKLGVCLWKAVFVPSYTEIFDASLSVKWWFLLRCEQSRKILTKKLSDLWFASSFSFPPPQRSLLHKYKSWKREDFNE